MTTKDLIEYLQGFPPDSPVRLTAVTTEGRVIHDTLEIICITDQGVPAIFLRIDGGEPFDEEMTAAAEEDEQAI